MFKAEPEGEAALKNTVIRVHDHPAGIDATAWNALLAEQASATPFMRHEYLLRAARLGQRHREHRLAAAVPVGARGRHAGRRLPAVPQGPFLRRVRVRLGLGRRLPAPRPGLLPEAARCGAVHAGARRRACWRATRPAARVAAAGDAATRDARPSCRRRTCCSSTTPTAQRRATAGWMMRSTVQFHWRNREPAPYADFADFLASLQREKRKKIQQERRRVAEAGVQLHRRLQGDEISRDRLGLLLPLLHADLPRAPLDALPDARLLRAHGRARWPQHWLLFIAWRDGERIATSLIGIDPDRRRRVRPLLGRHRTRPLPALRGLLLPAARLVHRATATSVSKAARRASTRWRAACCRCRPSRRTGSRTRSSRRRWRTSWSAKAPASISYVDELNERRPFKAA